MADIPINLKGKEPIAMQFTARGYHAFVFILQCSSNNIHNHAWCPGYVYHQENAEQWNIDKDKVAICGFSAGAHLAASLGVNYNKPYLKTEGIVLGENRPDTMILSYTVITMKEFRHNGSRENLIGKSPSDILIKINADTGIGNTHRHFCGIQWKICQYQLKTA